MCRSPKFKKELQGKITNVLNFSDEKISENNDMELKTGKFYLIKLTNKWDQIGPQKKNNTL